jgi:DNA-binding NarL/FixJ family response regulator
VRCARADHNGGMEKTTADRITAFIVEDSPHIRERLTALLSQTDGITIVGEADTPQSAVEGILRTRPDSVVLDIHLIGGSSLEVLKTVRPVAPGTVFVVLTNHPNSQYRRIFSNAGASAFLDKSTEFDMVAQAIIAGAARRSQIPNLQ